MAILDPRGNSTYFSTLVIAFRDHLSRDLYDLGERQIRLILEFIN